MHTSQVLKQAGLSVTPVRQMLMKVLQEAAHPLTVHNIHSRMGVGDIVTVYRNVQKLLEVGLVSEVRFKDSETRYEYAEKGHHHHIVCTACGVVDELLSCEVHELENKVLKESKRFGSISEHQLEFFGLCRACSR